MQGARPEGAEPRLLTLPVNVFKAADPGHEPTESWCFDLVLETPSSGAWHAQELEIVLRSGSEVVSRTTLSGSALAARVVRLASDATSTRSAHRPLLVRVADFAPIAAKIDTLECVLRASAPDESAHVARAQIRFLPYEQRTALVFPFRGRGIVTQGGANDGGHSNRSGQFAVDAVGLTDMYAPQLSHDEVNEAAAGFGRPILAAGAGIVARMRADRPDQPVPGNSDAAFRLPEFRDGGDPGNHVVIDHDNGEHSMIAHLQKDSVRVKPGQRLEQGEPIGLLGNSGDSTFPHVHYQLMDGPDWMACDALPVRFTNVPERLVRGTWFHAR